MTTHEVTRALVAGELYGILASDGFDPDRLPLWVRDGGWLGRGLRRLAGHANEAAARAALFDEWTLKMIAELEPKLARLIPRMIPGGEAPSLEALRRDPRIAAAVHRCSRHIRRRFPAFRHAGRVLTCA